MKIISLNIRGFGSDGKVQNLSNLSSKESVDCCVIQESLLPDDATNVVKMVWKHCDYGFFQMPSIGRSGGLLSMWRKDLFVADYAFAGTGYSGVEGKWKGCDHPILFINIYASQDRSAKQKL